MNTPNKKRSFFDRLTGSIRAEEEYIEVSDEPIKGDKKNGNGWMEEENEEFPY